MTEDGNYFDIDFDELVVYNPNLIPHPTKQETWIMVAKEKLQLAPITHEMACDGIFRDGRMHCSEPAFPLPIANTTSYKCEGGLGFLNFNRGPHDARVFYGPEHPYTIYGSNSGITCFGQFVQDLRALYQWPDYDEHTPSDYRIGTELSRPPPHADVEKNWFMLWDSANQPYVHYDMAPKRVYAALYPNGRNGEDLAPMAASNDEQCAKKYLPIVSGVWDSFHQATNSLRITLCSRKDPTCIPNDKNTYIMNIFHHKQFVDFHSIYFPLVTLFDRSPPFAMHSVAARPFWVSGRKGPLAPKQGEEIDWSTSEMVYITSMSWKGHDQKYDGYIDDTLFLAFGIEDAHTGGMDIRAGDLLQSMGFCSDLSVRDLSKPVIDSQEAPHATMGYWSPPPPAMANEPASKDDY